MAESLAELPGVLCRVFLGWRLGDDRQALLALGEGALRIDLRSGECWCDDEPLPALFIAGELMREIERSGRGDSIDEARLDALFANRPRWTGGREVPALELACRVWLRQGSEEYVAEAHNRAGGA